MVSKDNISQLFVREREEKGDTFDLIYRGHSEIDRHYTKAMLPWIISEVKNQHKMLQVAVTIRSGLFEVVEKDTSKHVLSHNIKQIHKCVMEQADHRCFLYTLRPPEKDLSVLDHSESSATPLPSNLNSYQNYQCHLYQALTEQEVRNFFCCLRAQPRDAKIQDMTSVNTLPDLSVHTESQFFEVLFIGRVKVSHCKVPVTFIDEALTAFRRKEKYRQRNLSGESRKGGSPSRILSFQQDGSGHSFPNIHLRNIAMTADLDSSAMKSIRRDSGECTKAKETKASKVQFHLGGSFDDPSPSSSRRGSTPSPQSSMTSHSSRLLQESLKEIEDEDSSVYSEKEQQEKEKRRSEQGNTSILQTSKSSATTKSESCATEEIIIEPLRDRIRRQSSGEGSSDALANSDPVKRARAGSFGSAMSNRATVRASDTDLKALGCDFNRTMLFHIGHREIQLINPEMKSVQLHKPFKDIAGCCQGVKCSDHFGFICRELSGDAVVFVGYIFRCDKSAVADEILQALNRSFSAMHEAHERDRKEHLMCDYCPLKWFCQLCAEVEGLSASKAYSVIMKKVVTLPDDERESIIAKYEGAETSDVAQKNNVLMMLLRMHFEYKQSSHSHPSLSDGQRSDFNFGTNIESSLKKARKNIATSFTHLLKRDAESMDREVRRNSEELSSPTTAMDSERSAATTKVPTITTTVPMSGPSGSCVLEGISDSPLKSFRKRSSTLSAAEGASMRREFLAATKLEASAQKSEKYAVNSTHKDANKNMNSNSTQKHTGPKLNIFLKFGGQSQPADNNSPEQEVEPQNKRSTSFRHAILQKVVSPAKGVTEPPSRKVSQTLQPHIKRSGHELKLLWKKSVFQQMLLIRIERENQRLRALQKEAALQRVRLNYEEEELPIDALQTWELLLSRPQVRIDTNVLFSGIKQGVPKFVRGDVWNLLMIQDQRFDQPHQKSNKKSWPPHYNAPYEAMLKELTSQQHAILIDLGRTFPSHPYFTQTLGPGQLALFNILKAYSILDQEVGYCQGLSFVGGVLLMHVEEEVAYELLKHLMFEKCCRKQYCPDLDGLQVRMYQLSRLIHDQLPDLYSHLEEHEITPQLYAAPWFLTLFASQYPLNFVVRVFDLLFLIGMEAVFCVALVLLRTHEEELLSLDSFEQLMEYFKITVPSIQRSQLNLFFAEVCECNLRRELAAYEVEFQVLQEELTLSPMQNADIQKLHEATKNLKRQNLDLLEQILTSNKRQNDLETTNQYLQQSQHHLEVRVRWLEMERNNLRRVIQILIENSTKEAMEKIPPNLERYLPHRASSPMSDDRRYGANVNLEGSVNTGGRGKSPYKESNSPPREISITVPRQRSFSPVKNIAEGLGKASQGQANTRSSPEHLSPLPDGPPRHRSSTLDSKAMHSYFKNFIRAD